MDDDHVVIERSGRADKPHATPVGAVDPDSRIDGKREVGGGRGDATPPEASLIADRSRGYELEPGCDELEPGCDAAGGQDVPDGRTLLRPHPPRPPAWRA